VRGMMTAMLLKHQWLSLPPELWLYFAKFPAIVPKQHLWRCLCSFCTKRWDHILMLGKWLLLLFSANHPGTAFLSSLITW
jgi:hypothetical protein